MIQNILQERLCMTFLRSDSFEVIQIVYIGEHLTYAYLPVTNVV